MKHSAIKLFPSVGIYDTKQTYTTTNMVKDLEIADNPTGYDEFTMNNKDFNIRNRDIVKLKETEIRIKDSLIHRKHKRVK